MPNRSPFVLALLAAFAVCLLRLQATENASWLAGECALALGICLVGLFRGFGIFRDASQEQIGLSRFSGGLTPGGLALGTVCICLPLLSKLFQVRLLGGGGEATELVWLSMLQYAALWQSAIASSTKEEWISFLLSCFLMLFGLASSDRSGMVVIVVLFGVLAGWWLMSRYWQSIQGGFIANESVPMVRLRLGAILFALLLTTGIGLVAMTAGATTTALDGFMPTSGGKKWSDPAARQGVGDGDMLVAAKDQAFTFGPVESDLFLDSPVPSLYDLVSDAYGEPIVRKEYMRAISLDSKIQESEQQATESKKSGREFSAVRRPNSTTDGRKPEGTASRAVLHLIGQVPQHLRMESYDAFDGIQWSHSDGHSLQKVKSVPTLIQLYGKPWIELQKIPSAIAHPVRERQTVKVMAMKSVRLLTPSLLTHTHIDRVDKPDFFGWTDDGQLMMTGQTQVPSMTVVHQLYQTPQLHSLRDAADPLSALTVSDTVADSDPLGWKKNYLQLNSLQSESLRQQAKALVEKHWHRSLSSLTDWQRIEGIVGSFRNEFVHDRLASAPEECLDVVHYFLDKQRGPDYLFATSAVTLVRSLGIPCRLVTGFYASPKRFDTKSGQTEILPEDLHTWAEVYCHGAWLPIEPTPGYAVPNEYRSWKQWAVVVLWTIRDGVLHYPLRCAIGFLVLATFIVCRLVFADAILSLCVAAIAMIPSQSNVRWTLRLMRWRDWLRNRPNPARSTVSAWLAKHLADHSRLSAVDRTVYIQAVDRIAYAPQSISQPWLNKHSLELRRICWSIAARGWIDLLFQPAFLVPYSRWVKR